MAPKGITLSKPVSSASKSTSIASKPAAKSTPPAKPTPPVTVPGTKNSTITPKQEADTKAVQTSALQNAAAKKSTLPPQMAAKVDKALNRVDTAQTVASVVLPTTTSTIATTVAASVLPETPVGAIASVAVGSVAAAAVSNAIAESNIVPDPPQVFTSSLSTAKSALADAGAAVVTSPATSIISAAKQAVVLPSMSSSITGALENAVLAKMNPFSFCTIM